MSPPTLGVTDQRSLLPDLLRFLRPVTLRGITSYHVRNNGRSSTQYVSHMADATWLVIGFLGVAAVAVVLGVADRLTERRGDSDDRGPT